MILKSQQKYKERKNEMTGLYLMMANDIKYKMFYEQMQNIFYAYWPIDKLHLLTIKKERLSLLLFHFFTRFFACSWGKFRPAA